MAMMNCHDTASAPRGSVVANDSHWPSLSLTATRRPRHPPKFGPIMSRIIPLMSAIPPAGPNDGP